MAGAEAEARQAPIALTVELTPSGFRGELPDLAVLHFRCSAEGCGEDIAVLVDVHHAQLAARTHADTHVPRLEVVEGIVKANGHGHG